MSLSVMEDDYMVETKLYAMEPSQAKLDETSKYNKIELPRHSIYAVFDGHGGGTFSANYAAKNFCRVMSHQPKFVEYAIYFQEHHQKESS